MDAVQIDWHTTPLRAERFLEKYGPRCRASSPTAPRVTSSTARRTTPSTSCTSRSGRTAPTSSATGSRARCRRCAQSIAGWDEQPVLPHWNVVVARQLAVCRVGLVAEEPADLSPGATPPPRWMPAGGHLAATAPVLAQHHREVDQRSGCACRLLTLPALATGGEASRCIPENRPPERGRRGRGRRRWIGCGACAPARRHRDRLALTKLAPAPVDLDRERPARARATPRSAWDGSAAEEKERPAGRLISNSTRSPPCPAPTERA